MYQKPVHKLQDFKKKHQTVPSTSVFPIKIPIFFVPKDAELDARAAALRRGPGLADPGRAAEAEALAATAAAFRGSGEKAFRAFWGEENFGGFG